jgi:predicted carbohydrate-binding protein with CBM5 and CBM33 domain
MGRDYFVAQALLAMTAPTWLNTSAATGSRIINWRGTLIHIAKHFRYWYQQEYRITWIPPLDYSDHPLEPLFLEVGSLQEKAQLIKHKVVVSAYTIPDYCPADCNAVRTGGESRT